MKHVRYLKSTTTKISFSSYTEKYVASVYQAIKICTELWPPFYISTPRYNCMQICKSPDPILDALHCSLVAMHFKSEVYSKSSLDIAELKVAVCIAVKVCNVSEAALVVSSITVSIWL
jgi:hypothetical protein